MHSARCTGDCRLCKSHSKSYLNPLLCELRLSTGSCGGFCACEFCARAVSTVATLPSEVMRTILRGVGLLSVAFSVFVPAPAPIPNAAPPPAPAPSTPALPPTVPRSTRSAFRCTSSSRSSSISDTASNASLLRSCSRCPCWDDDDEGGGGRGGGTSLLLLPCLRHAISSRPPPLRPSLGTVFSR